jgi:hypothetical protein
MKPKTCYMIADVMGNMIGDYQSHDTVKDALANIEGMLGDLESDLLDVINKTDEIYIWEMKPVQKVIITEEAKFSVSLEKLK